MAVNTLFQILKSFVPPAAGGITLTAKVARLFGPTTAVFARLSQNFAVKAYTNGGNNTLTVDDICGGLITVDPSSGNRTETMPTAALIMAAFPKMQVGHVIEFSVKNLAASTNTVTLAVASDGTLFATDVFVIAAASTTKFRLRITNVSTPAWVLYTDCTSLS